MTNPLASKPNAGSVITIEQDGKMITSPEHQRFFDDVEETLNDTSANIHTPAVFAQNALPDVEVNGGRIIYVKNLTPSPIAGTLPQDMAIPCWGAIPFPYGVNRIIASAINAAGATQFNMTGGAGNIVHAGEKVLISGYAPIDGYNGIHTAAAFSGDGFFQVTGLTFTVTSGGLYKVLGNWRNKINGAIVVPT